MLSRIDRLEVGGADALSGRLDMPGGAAHEESRADGRCPRVCVRCAAGGGWPRVFVQREC